MKSIVYSDGNSPILVKLTIGGEEKTKQIDAVPRKYWNNKKRRVKTTHSDHVKINDLIDKREQEAKDYLRECRLKGEIPSAESFFKKGAVSAGASIYDLLMHEYDELMELEKISQAYNFRNPANWVKKFAPEMRPGQVTAAWLAVIDTQMKSKGLKPSTRNLYISRIRTVCAPAFEDKKPKDNPFLNGQFKMPTGQDAILSKLTKDEFELWRHAELPDDLILTRDFYAFMVFARGMRVTDALTALTEDYIHSQGIYTMRKNEKRVNMRLRPEALELIERYKGQSKYYLFPIIQLAPQVEQQDKIRYYNETRNRVYILNQKIKKIAALLGIQKNLHNHTARHTFAKLVDEADIPLAKRQHLFMHSRIETTMRYTEENRRDDEIDEAADQVFDQIKTKRSVKFKKKKIIRKGT